MDGADESKGTKQCRRGSGLAKTWRFTLDSIPKKIAKKDLTIHNNFRKRSQESCNSREKNCYANPGSYKVTAADADFAMQMRERHSESSV